jgi:hypothetical protein
VMNNTQAIVITFRPGKQIAPPEKLLLIDLCWGCLVEMPGTVKYCALSYIWGELPDSLETRKENIELLKQNGSITSKSNRSLLPQTVRDAIRLLQSLGQRYLWVDRLCIIQNDDENKHLNIMRMDSIYSNSYLTIVAADGLDANHGTSWSSGRIAPTLRHTMHGQFSARHLGLRITLPRISTKR